MTVENFLSDWNSGSQPVEGKTHKRTFGNYEVEINASARADTIRLNSIRSLKPKCGELKKLLSWLAKRADKRGVLLTMACQPFGWNKDELPDKDKLKEVARRYNFTVKFEYPDGDGYEMIRKPKK